MARVTRMQKEMLETEVGDFWLVPCHGSILGSSERLWLKPINRSRLKPAKKSVVFVAYTRLKPGAKSKSRLKPTTATYPQSCI